MPYKRKYQRKKMSKRRLAKPTIKTMIQREINKTQEVKVKYVALDEITTPMGSQKFMTGLTNVSSGNSPEQRIGDTIRPKQLVVEGWMRPTKLFGATADADFQIAGFSRLCLLRQAAGARIDGNTDADPAPVDFSTTRLFLGAKGRVEGKTDDYKDIIRPWNYSVVRPPNKGSDRTYFFSMQPHTNNTRRFKFVHNFNQNDEMKWIRGGSYPNKGQFHLALINRFATDDVESDEYSIEVCAESRFYYYDA